MVKYWSKQTFWAEKHVFPIFFFNGSETKQMQMKVFEWLEDGTTNIIFTPIKRCYFLWVAKVLI